MGKGSLRLPFGHRVMERVGLAQRFRKPQAGPSTCDNAMKTPKR